MLCTHVCVRACVLVCVCACLQIRMAGGHVGTWHYWVDCGLVRAARVQVSGIVCTFKRVCVLCVILGEQIIQAVLCLCTQQLVHVFRFTDGGRDICCL